MPPQWFETDSDRVDKEIQRVLEAERACEEKLQDCRRRAQRQVAAARGRAEAIARRTDARLAKLRASHLQKIEREIAVLGRSPEPAAEVAKKAEDIAALARVAERVAVKLTGREDEPPR